MVFPPRSVKHLMRPDSVPLYGSLIGQLYPNAGAMRREQLRISVSLFNDPRLWSRLAVYCFVTVVAKYRAESVFVQESPVRTG
jgi:hypothetical protein